MSGTLHFGAIDSVSDRRTHFRERVLFSCAQLGEENGGIVLNISEGGVALQVVTELSDQDLPPLRFQFSHSHTWVEATGRIAWLSDSKKTVGVEFTNLPEEARRQIKAWISSLNAAGEFVQSNTATSKPVFTARALRSLFTSSSKRRAIAGRFDTGRFGRYGWCREPECPRRISEGGPSCGFGRCDFVAGRVPVPGPPRARTAQQGEGKRHGCAGGWPRGSRRKSRRKFRCASLHPAGQRFGRALVTSFKWARWLTGRMPTRLRNPCARIISRSSSPRPAQPAASTWCLWAPMTSPIAPIASKSSCNSKG